jgi:hypothetical protein
MNNPQDIIKVDVPLFIRLLEYAREDAKTDMDLHDLTENITRLSGSGKTLTMKEYDQIIHKKSMDEVRRLQKLANVLQENIKIEIPENTSYVDFAISVADTLREDYGEHLYKRFVEKLVEELKK